MAKVDEQNIDGTDQSVSDPGVGASQGDLGLKAKLMGVDVRAVIGIIVVVVILIVVVLFFYAAKSIGAS